MAVTYHIEKLDQLLKDLAGALRVSILILDANGEQLSKISDPSDFCSQLQQKNDVQQLCHQCDRTIVERCKRSKKVEKHLCHAGLCDLAMPIVKDNTVIAYVVLGRIRTAQSPVRSHRYTADFQALYEKLPLFSDDQLQHLSKLLPQIILDSAISVEHSTYSEDIIPYITEHIAQPLSVSVLCQRYHVSKNTLYRFFRKKYSCSIVEFITNARMQQAMSLLTQTEHTVRDIAEQIGIENYTYFCKLFKQQLGMTPTEYRKANHKKPPA